MFKSFSFALVAAMAAARGTNNGSTKNNAYSAELVNQDGNELWVHVWNTWSPSQGYSLVGELEIKVVDSPPIIQVYACIGLGEDTYDCVAGYVSDLDKETWGLSIFDKYKDADGLALDNKEKGESSFQQANGSGQLCTEGETAGFFNCNISLAFQRKFQTADGIKDVQLTEADADRDFIVTGQIDTLDVVSGERESYGLIGDNRSEIKLVSQMIVNAAQASQQNSANNSSSPTDDSAAEKDAEEQPLVDPETGEVIADEEETEENTEEVTDENGTGQEGQEPADEDSDVTVVDGEEIVEEGASRTLFGFGAAIFAASTALAF